MRRLAALALPALIAGPAVTLTAHHAGAEVHRPAACSAPNRAVMQRTPTVTKLPEGAQLNVWDNHGSGTSRVRVTQVLVPHTSPLHLSLLTAGALTKAAPPGTIAQQHKNVVAMSNADIFDPVRGSLPTGDEVLNGKVAKAQSVLQNAVLIAKNGQSSPAGHIRLTGTVKAGGHSQHITGLNWQSLSGSGVNLYTAPWGHGRRPYGAVDVVVKSGKVVAVRRGSTRGQPPGNGEQILTANGAAATFLETLRPNEKVSVRYGFSSPGAPFKVWQAVNHGAPYLMNGKDWPVPCSSRNEILRPRTAVGWTKQGDLMLVVVSGENSAAEGGSTLPNMEYYLRALHAYNADAMDGGFSSTLVVRKKAGGAVSRVDRPGAAQRHVPNYLAFD